MEVAERVWFLTLSSGFMKTLWTWLWILVALQSKLTTSNTQLSVLLHTHAPSSRNFLLCINICSGYQYVKQFYEKHIFSLHCRVPTTLPRGSTTEVKHVTTLDRTSSDFDRICSSSFDTYILGFLGGCDLYRLRSSGILFFVRVHKRALVSYGRVVAELV